MKLFGKLKCSLVVLLIALLVVAGCGDEDAPGGVSSVVVTETDDGGETPYGQNQDVIVTDEGTFVVTTNDAGESGDNQGGSEEAQDCVVVGDDCIGLDETRGRYCDDENAQADFIVVDGEVVDVICYPPAEDGTPVEEVVRDEEGDATVPQSESGAVIVFDEETDGEPIEGDVSVDAERSALFGNGADKTIIDGDLNVASNNSRVRGVTVTGNVTFSSNANNASLAFCKAHGGLTVDANNFSLLECQVFGDLSINGNDAVLVNVGVAGEWSPGRVGACHGCYSFSDEDMDFNVADDEQGDPLCEQDSPQNSNATEVNP